MNENQEYDIYSKRMEEQFPDMFAGRYGGFAVGQGWWPLVETLCKTIQGHIKNNKDCPQVIVEQVKEKFGGLRFYYQGGDDFIHGAVWLAESLSLQICEECGTPGERRGGGWIRTLCNKHETLRQEELRRREMQNSGLEE